MRLWTPSDKTGLLIWAGLFSARPDGIATPTSLNLAAFRFQSASPNSPWEVAVSNGSGSFVTIEFLGGSEITFPAGGSGPQSAFKVTAPNFKCRGARAVFEITAGSNMANRTFVRIEADETECADCVFDVKQSVASSTPIDRFACIRVVSDPDLFEPIRRNFKVTRCTFIIQPGTPQEFCWIPVLNQPPTPRGICGIFANRVNGCILTENSFRSGSQTAKGECGPAIYLTNVEECTISASTFRGLRIPTGIPTTIPPIPPSTSADRGSLIRIYGGVGAGAGEGHHTVISANAVDDLDTGHVIALDLALFDFVSANLIDRVGPNCYSAVRARSGSVLGIVGNSISRITGPTSGAGAEGVIRLDTMGEVLIAGNVLTDIATGTKLIDIQSDTSRNTVVSPTQARLNTP